MITKKLKNFEYAAINSSIKAGDQTFSSEVKAFETPNGHVFLSVVAHGKPDENNSTSMIVCERVKYYLENEVLDNAVEAVFNALSYTNGYVFEMKRKNQLAMAAKASVACVLVQNFKSCYGWMGDASFLFFNGKRTYSMGWPLVNDKNQNYGNGKDSGCIVYLGDRQIFEPAVCEQPLVPVDGDIFVAGAGKVWESIKPKVFNGILADSMPLLTKAQRLTGIAGENYMEGCSALQLITFYNLEGNEPPVFESPNESTTESKQEVEIQLDGRPTNTTIEKRPLRKKIIIACCLLAVAYMFYDLFIKDSSRIIYTIPAEISTEATQPEPSTTQVVAPTSNTMRTQQKLTLPADVVYTVKTGDNWSIIYREFEVCSWFIKNHPPNSGKFDQDENPVDGRTIAIPVMYSAKKSLNPNFYTEFSLEKLGRTCQNANVEFKEAFEKKVKR